MSTFLRSTIQSINIAAEIMSGGGAGCPIRLSEGTYSYRLKRHMEKLSTNSEMVYVGKKLDEVGKETGNRNFLINIK